ncbi:helix-turn-helix transcriptional regulator [Yoonia sp.]|uniref:helix-turn-helix transcriptional regulator n=1 Tax=Yoonia sp. TaxID=2212373 RepID=UPI003F70994A
MSKFTQEQLAQRWHLSPRTLEQWRWLGKGPKFLKIGARVLYREEDVEAWEAAQVCQNTSGPLPRGDE